MRTRVFVDTNSFIHLRDLKDLPWAEVFPDVSELEIMVAHVVIDELDRLKTEKNGRTRDRCRAALRLIEQASTQQGMRLELRSKPFRIFLVIAEDKRVDWTAIPRLDSSRADDHLVAAALSGTDSTPATLVSYDTGPLIRARVVGLPATRSPESWHLPPQQDEAEQKIGRLERELAAAKATRPSISVKFLDTDFEGVLRLTIPRLEPVSPAKQSRMMELLRQRFPRQHVRASDPGPFRIHSLGMITPYAVESYYREYDDFIELRRQQFSSLHLLVQEALQFGEIRFNIRNESAVTAQNIRLSLRCSDDLMMFGSIKDMAGFGGALRRIEPPDPPTEGLPVPMVHPAAMFDSHRRDPTGFYWVERPRGNRDAILVCDEYRATLQRLETFYVGSFGPSHGTLSLEISATNLASPVKMEVELTISPGEGSWSDPPVLRRLPKWLAEIIAASD